MACSLARFLLLLYIGAQQALCSHLDVHFVDDGHWNKYCNTSSYAMLRGVDNSVILKPSKASQSHRLYGSCLMSFGNARKDGYLHLTFMKYPAFHQCVNGDLTFYELIGGKTSVLWHGRCGDALYSWPPRSVITKASDVWIWYSKQPEWPELLPYKEISFELSISTVPLSASCDDAFCNYRGECILRSADPPRNFTTVSEDRILRQCHCVQPYTGATCDKIKFMETACATTPCFNQGVCVVDADKISGYFCECKAPYRGDHCEYNSAICLPSTDLCGANGKCIVVQGGVQCRCYRNWMGAKCDILSPCVVDPCFNGGSCVAKSETSFMCLCVGPWKGELCSLNAHRPRIALERLMTLPDISMHAITTPTSQAVTASNSTIISTNSSDIEEKVDVTKSGDTGNAVGLPGMAIAFINIGCLLLLLLCFSCVWVIRERSQGERKAKEDNSDPKSKQSSLETTNKWKGIMRLIPSTATLVLEEEDRRILPNVYKLKQNKNVISDIISRRTTKESGAGDKTIKKKSFTVRSIASHDKLLEIPSYDLESAEDAIALSMTKFSAPPTIIIETPAKENLENSGQNNLVSAEKENRRNLEKEQSDVLLPRQECRPDYIRLTLEENGQESLPPLTNMMHRHAIDIKAHRMRIRKRLAQVCKSGSTSGNEKISPATLITSSSTCTSTIGLSTLNHVSNSSTLACNDRSSTPTLDEDSTALTPIDDAMVFTLIIDLNPSVEDSSTLVPVKYSSHTRAETIVSICEDDDTLVGISESILTRDVPCVPPPAPETRRSNSVGSSSKASLFSYYDSTVCQHHPGRGTEYKHPECCIVDVNGDLSELNRFRKNLNRELNKQGHLVLHSCNRKISVQSGEPCLIHKTKPTRNTMC